MPDEAAMSLAHAYDALSDEVSRFHNEMLRQGVTMLRPREWVSEFRSWLNEYEFERRHSETLESPAEARR